MDNKDTLLLNEVNPRPCIRPHTYAVIFHFVPCDGSFNPSLDSHLQDLEKETNLPMNSIAAASWCKHPDRRSPSQTTATLKVACISPDVANHLLTGWIHIDDHLTSVRKDIQIPIRCVKCQGYGHTQDRCIGIKRCSNCTSEFHRADICNRQHSCMACGPGSQHPSISLACPVFMQKCDVLDMHFPENAMLYFPSNKSWTWTSRPTNLLLPDSLLPPPPPCSTQTLDIGQLGPFTSIRTEPKLGGPNPPPHPHTCPKPAPPHLQTMAGHRITIVKLLYQECGL